MKKIPLLENVVIINEANKTIKDFLDKNKEKLKGGKADVTYSDGKKDSGIIKSISASSNPSGVSIKINHGEEGDSYHMVKEHLLADLVSKKEIELFNGDKLKIN